MRYQRESRLRLRRRRRRLLRRRPRRAEYLPTNVRGLDYWWRVIAPREQSLLDYPARERNFQKNLNGIAIQISFI